MRVSRNGRLFAAFLTLLTTLLVAAGCSPKVDREAPTGSAPPGGDKGVVQPGTINKAPATD